MNIDEHEPVDTSTSSGDDSEGHQQTRFYCEAKPRASRLSPPAPTPKPKPSRLRIFDNSGRVITLSTLRHILSNMRSRQVAVAHAAVHTRLATRCEFEDRRKLLKLLSRLDNFPDDTLPAYFGCLRIDGAPARITVAGKQMNLTTALRWLCTAVDDELLESARSGEAPLASTKQPAYKQQIVSMCGTDNCVNPQHYNERLYAKQTARARRMELFADLRDIDNNLDELVGQMYMADMDHDWIRTERELARDPKVHSAHGVEAMLDIGQPPDFLPADMFANRTLKHAAATTISFDDNQDNNDDDDDSKNETLPLVIGTLLRERVLEPIDAKPADDMLCDA
jgi:hypothetical protein